MPRILEALQRFRENQAHPSLELTKAPHYRKVPGIPNRDIYFIRASHRQRIMMTLEEGRWVLQGFPDRSDSHIFKSE